MKLDATKRAAMGALFVTILGLLLGSSVLAGCGNSGSSGGAATAGHGGASMAGGAGGTASTMTGTGTTGGGGTGGKACIPADCSDTFSCTIDACKADGTCSHTIGPNSGATGCPPGQFCTLDAGCIAAPACATVEDCKNAWKDDACKTEIACDAASSLCTFKPLDKDKDGHPPPVCGGDDCDDSTATAYPGAGQDVCDALDNDCDGQVDEDPDCESQNPLNTCQNGKCKCKPANDCSGFCVDLVTDPNHCGMCFLTCGFGDCVNGACVCGPDETKCPDVGCQNLKVNPAHCGSCGKVCAPGTNCNNGICTCPAETPDLCDNTCIDLGTDPTNCGTCGNVCSADEPDCVAGTCICDPSGDECGGTAGGARCGNGDVEGSEECDDDNQTDGDGCSSRCLLE